MDQTTCSACGHVHQNADGTCGATTDTGTCDCQEGKKEEAAM